MAADIVDVAKGAWTPVLRTGRAAATLARISRGRREHGERFLIGYYGNEHGGRSLHRPVGTLTTRDRWAIVDGDRMRMLTPDEVRAGMGFPQGYQLPENRRLAVHLLGNAVCPPVARDLLQSIQEAA